MIFEVIKTHRSNYPNPIILYKGQSVIVGKKYDGPENWHHWIYCYTMDRGLEGWVPEQIIQMNDGNGMILEDYTAEELNVDIGERVAGFKELNGWIWCEKLHNRHFGWVPKDHLRPE